MQEFTGHIRCGSILHSRLVNCLWEQAVKNKEELSRDLGEADLLAKFANEEFPSLPDPPHSTAPVNMLWTNPAGKDAFSSLLPASFWELSANEGVNWNYKTFQHYLRQAWKERFPASLVLHLVQLPTTDLWDALNSGKTYPYQNAIMLLHGQPWRVAFCPRCGKRFVKNKPHQLFCGESCFGPHRRAEKAKHEKQRRKKLKKK